MSISQTAGMLVWNRARGLCSICKRDLVDIIGADATITGERAHITAAQPGGERYDPELTDAQRNGYDNLILLCGDCHNKVDKAPKHYSVARLHAIKSEHESYCSELLTMDDERRARATEVLATVVDYVVDALSLDRWEEWTANALGPSPYKIPRWWMKEPFLFGRSFLEGTLWPENAGSLAIAAKMSLDAASAFYDTFCRFSPSDNHDLNRDFLACDSISVMISRRRVSDEERFVRRLYDWNETLQLGLIHLTKCVNWFADAVREHVNPRFRLTKGAFILDLARYNSGVHGVYVFTQDEKDRILVHGYVDGSQMDTREIVASTWITPPARPHAEVEDGSNTV